MQNDDSLEFQAHSEHLTSTASNSSGLQTETDVNASCETSQTVIAENNATNNVEKSAVTDSTTCNISPYDYLKKDEFTSERFKIEIRGMHRQVGFKQLKKKMASLGLHPHKVKILKWGAYVTFMSAEERDSALAKMKGVIWKGNKLDVSIAKPRADPGLETMKRKLDDVGTNTKNPAKKLQLHEVDTESLDPAERLKRVVTPLYDVPYEEQLNMKTERMRELLCRYYFKILMQNPLLDGKLHTEEDHQSKKLMISPLGPILSSAALTHYRNKCEFTIGKDLDGNERVVGFHYGKHKGGDRSVGSPSGLIHISPHIEAVRLALQTFLEKNLTHLQSYNSMTYEGFWRTAVVRCTLAGDTMLSLEVCGSDWDNEDISTAADALRDYFTSESCSHLNLRSLFFVLRHRTADPLTESNCRLLFGDSHIIEKCLNLKFRISLSAFFQVNTLAAEVLYSKITQLVTTGSNIVVLDLCCGTGTIGLCIAKDVQKVIGVELCAEAVEDAKANAVLNDIHNAEYVCGKVEDVLPKILDSVSSENEIVAIVDPPRAGLHANVIGILRKHQRVQSIIYVSCNPEAAGTNFIDLSRQESNRMRGTPFIPVEATPIDLFPHTKHVELVMMWRRVTNS